MSESPNLFDDIPMMDIDEAIAGGFIPGVTRSVEPRPLTAFSAQTRRPEPAYRERSTTVAPDRPAANVLSVAAALERLQRAVQGQMTGWWISGEVSNCSRAYASGHVYFTLKDGAAQVRCVYFAGAQRRNPPSFRDGDRIEILGESDVYIRGGDLQIRLSNWRPAGLGALYEAYLQLKNRLRQEGLFESPRKKTLPAFIRRIAVVTSAQAAAYQDVRRTMARRMPWVRMTLVETPVQGQEAPAGIVRALRRADELGADAVLLVRGGGSFEDLFCFSDERVVRAVAAMRTPVVTGIGHETDETLAQLAADIGASTPTAAAEQLGHDGRFWEKRLDEFSRSLGSELQRIFDEAEMTLDYQERQLVQIENRLVISAGQLEGAESRLRRSAETALESIGNRFERSAKLFASPETYLLMKTRELTAQASRLEAIYPRVIGMKAQRLDAGINALRLLTAGGLEHRESVLAAYAQRLQRPEKTVAAAEQQLRRLSASLGTQVPRVLAHSESRLNALCNALCAYDPDKVLLRGFSLVNKGDRVVESIGDVSRGDTLTIRLSDGDIAAEVTGTTSKKVVKT